MRLSNLLFSLIFLLPIISNAQNAAPEIEITNVFVNEQTKTLFITYSLSDAENEDCEVSLFISENNGKTYPIDASNATGEIGFPITPGITKVITWEFDGLLTSDVNLHFKLVADDKFEINIEDIVALTDSNRLRSNLEFLEGIRNRSVNVAHLEATKDSIENTFINAGLKSEVFTFMRGNYEAHNFLGTLQGTSESSEYFLLGGHYDTVTDSPGADDNGSAIAGMMEAVAVMKDFNFEKSIKFIGLDLEEIGLVGSTDFVTNNLPADESLLGFLNFEMIGYFTNEPFTQTFPPGFQVLFPDAAGQVNADSARGNFLTVVGNQTHAALADSFVNASQQYVPQLKNVKVISPQSGTLVPDLLRSDHAPFWIAGLPALMLTDGSEFRNPHYHTMNDRVETLNFTFMNNVVKAAIATIAKLAKPVHVGIATSPFSDVVSTTDIANFGIKIFPNPTSDFINIIFEKTDFKAKKINLISLDGKTVFEKEVEKSEQFLLPVSNVSSGVYLLQVIGNQGIAVERVVVD